jgi:hypothetical protein
MKLKTLHLPLLTIFAIVTTVSSWSCGVLNTSSKQSSSVTPNHREITVDTTVVIIRVFNYQPSEVTVYMDTQADRQRVGIVTSMHEAFFVVPSSEMPPVEEFILTVVPTEDGIKPYRTGLIARNRNRITMVYVAVGEHQNQENGLQNNAPAS